MNVLRVAFTRTLLVTGLLGSALVACNQTPPNPVSGARALGGGGGLHINVFYDALKPGTKPNGVRDKGEPLIGQLPVEIVALNPETLKPVGAPKLFTTSDKEPLFVSLEAGLYSVRPADVLSADPRFQWVATGVNSWIVQIDPRLTQTAFFPRVCRGEVITGADEMFRCDGKARFGKPPLVPFTLSGSAGAPIFECSHDSNASSLSVTVNPSGVLAGNPVSVSVTPFWPGISVSAAQTINTGSTGSFKLETRRTLPGTYSLSVSGTYGSSGFNTTVPITVVADADGAPGDCFAKLENNSDSFGAVYASGDGSIYSSSYNSTTTRGAIRRFAPGATTSGVSYITPLIADGASGIVRFGSSAAGDVYASEVSLNNLSMPPSSASGRVLRLGNAGWALVPLSFLANETPTLFTAWNGTLYVSTAGVISNSFPFPPSRLIAVNSGGALLSAPSGESIAAVRVVGSRLFVATDDTQTMRLYEWIGGALTQRCTFGGRFIGLIGDALGGLLVSTQNAVYTISSSGTTCTPDARTWAANRVLLVRAGGTLVAASAGASGELLSDVSGSMSALYPGQPLPSAFEMIEADGRLWVATANGLYRITP
jgi:hypothetical protein